MRRAWFWFTSQGPIIVAFVILATASLLSAVGQFLDERTEAETRREQARLLERAAFEEECRYNLSLPVSDAQAQKLDALALGLVALVAEDEAALRAQIGRIQEASLLELEAREARRGAIQTCDQRAELLFGS